MIPHIVYIVHASILICIRVFILAWILQSSSTISKFSASCSRLPRNHDPESKIKVANRHNICEYGTYKHADSNGRCLILAWLIPQGSTFSASLGSLQRCSTISRQIRVLVVDDDNGQRTVLKIMLSKNGCQVDTAEDGDDAVKAAQNVSYDLIFMDGCMPNKTGLEATKEIRANEAAKGLEVEGRSPFHFPLAQTI